MISYRIGRFLPTRPKYSIFRLLLGCTQAESKLTLAPALSDTNRTYDETLRQ